jgi:AAA15 family ATPase/GTPase
MLIKSFEIRNYMSFEDSGHQELSRHVNLIVGQNNAGKTALLKALAQRSAKPHRNASFNRDHVQNPIWELTFEFLPLAQKYERFC